MYICVEGIDGSGKTTIANLLANDLKCEIIEMNLEIEFGIEKELFNSIKKSYFKSINFNKKGILWFYLLKLFSIENKLCNENVITIRSFASLMGYIGNEESIFDLINSIITKPDITIVLKPDYFVLCERLKQRNSIDEIVSQKLFDDYYSRVIYCLEKYKFKYVIIDNSNIHENDIFKFIKGNMI